MGMKLFDVSFKRKFILSWKLTFEINSCIKH